jgi:hypothetical protein
MKEYIRLGKLFVEQQIIIYTFKASKELGTFIDTLANGS